MNVRALITALAAIALATVAAPRAATAQDHGSAPGQSIQVHGHWVIEVYDGEKVVERREFENALADGADILLANVLAGQDTVWDAAVVLEFTAPVGGYSALPIGAFDGSSRDLSTPDSGEDSGKILYTGSYTAPSEHTIDVVSYAVANGEPSQAGSGLPTTPLTAKDLPNDVTVQANQNVTVQVIISFTSG